MISIKKDINIQIGHRVKKARDSRNLSREQLAKKLGISTLFMGYIECGQKGMSLSTLQNLCVALEVSADYILLGLDSDNIHNTPAHIMIDSLDESYLPLIEENLKNLQAVISLAEEKSSSQT